MIRGLSRKNFLKAFEEKFAPTHLSIETCSISYTLGILACLTKRKRHSVNRGQLTLSLINPSKPLILGVKLEPPNFSEILLVTLKSLPTHQKGNNK